MGFASVTEEQRAALVARMVRMDAPVDSRPARCIGGNARLALSACVLLVADDCKFQAAVASVMIAQSSA